MFTVHYIIYVKYYIHKIFDTLLPVKDNVLFTQRFAKCP